MYANARKPSHFGSKSQSGSLKAPHGQPRAAWGRTASHQLMRSRGGELEATKAAGTRRIPAALPAPPIQLRCVRYADCDRRGPTGSPQWSMDNFIRFINSPQSRWYLIAIWIAVAAVVFISVGSWTGRSWSLLFVTSTIPPVMMLWFWNEDQRLVMPPIKIQRVTRDAAPTIARSSGRD
jgi:hypothetical protein